MRHHKAAVITPSRRKSPRHAVRVHAVVATLSMWEVAAAVSFSEDCVRFGDRLAKLVDAGVPVREASGRLGISRQRGYAILRAVGRPVGRPRPDVSGVDPVRVAAVFTETGSITQAAKAVGVSHPKARRLLVEQGSPTKTPIAYSANTSPKAPTSACTAPKTSNTSPSYSTAAHAKRSTGTPQPSAYVIY